MSPAARLDPKTTTTGLAVSRATGCFGPKTRSTRCARVASKQTRSATVTDRDPIDKNDLGALLLIAGFIVLALFA